MEGLLPFFPTEVGERKAPMYLLYLVPQGDSTRARMRARMHKSSARLAVQAERFAVSADEHAFSTGTSAVREVVRAFGH